jgi:hypothetical protein
MGRAYAGQGALSSYGLVSAVKIPAFRCDFELRSIGTTTLARISKTGLAADEHHAENDGRSRDHQRVGCEYSVSRGCGEFVLVDEPAE